MDDELAWVIQAQQGSQDAFTQLVEKYQTPVYNLCYRMLGEAEAAEDAAQETFLRAWQQARTLQDPATVGGWLFRIAHNLAMSRIRRPRTVPLVEDPPERLAAGSDEERWIAVLAAVGRLSQPHREVIAKRHFGGYRHDEIAAQLGIPPGTVRSRLARAYQELREMLVGQLQEG